MNVTYRGLADCPSALPVFPLAGALLLPRGALPLNIFEPRYLAMVDHVLAGERVIGMIQPDETNATATVPHLYSVGCAGRLTQFAETGDGRVLITLTGIARFRVIEAMPGRLFRVRRRFPPARGRGQGRSRFCRRCPAPLCRCQRPQGRLEGHP
jgi:hypothetical protein